jgi:CelD/BcsL family acetyltransferase involved in cellulose biosynthesis
VTFHSGEAGLQALRERWAAILARNSRSRFFHEWVWYRAYLRHLEPAPDEACFALFTSSNEPVAIVPLQHASKSFHGLTSKLWRLPEHSHLLLADVICADGISGAELVAALLEGMRAHRMQWDRVQFTGFGDESCLNCPELTDAHQSHRDILTTCDHVICNQPWHAFARRFSANFRSNLNKARHKVERTGTASYEMAHELGRIRALFEEFLRVEASGWKGAAGTRSAIGLDRRLIGFYQSLIDDFAPAGRISVNVMRVEDRVIASQFCLCDADTIHVYKQGYDENFAHLGPGNSLLEHLVRWCSASGRLRKISLVGRPHWFQDWKPEHSNVYRLHIFNRTPLGQVHRIRCTARARLRPWVRAAPRPDSSD